MIHPNCTHPTYIVTTARMLTSEQMQVIREALESGLKDGGDIKRVAVSCIPDAEVKVIECSWCRNPATANAASEAA